MGQREKVVIDTNIIVSGFGWDCKPEVILKLVENRLILSYITHEIFQEISKVIKYPKLKFSKQIQSGIIEFLINNSISVVPKSTYKIIINDPDDDKFIDCAVEANADYIITGNKHLLDLKNFGKIKIIKPDMFLEIFYENRINETS